MKWHNGTARKENLRLHNEFVGFQRAILIHEGYTMENTKGQAQGTSPRNTFGCLVIAKDIVKKNGNSNDFIDNVLQPDSTKKQELANAIKPNGFLNSHLAKLLNKKQVSIKEVADNIEIRVRNSFENNQANASLISLTFNGQFLTILINGEQKHSFQAVSGKAQEIDGKHYFTYEKERQMLENEGVIPEGGGGEIFYHSFK